MRRGYASIYSGHEDAHESIHVNQCSIVCPSVSSDVDTYSSLFGLLGGIVSFGFLTYFVLRAIVHWSASRRTPTTASADLLRRSKSLEARNARQFIVWLLMTVQVVSQVARVSSSSLPQFMQVRMRGDEGRRCMQIHQLASLTSLCRTRTRLLPCCNSRVLSYLPRV